MEARAAERARTPGETTRAFADSISRGDLEAAASCFAKDGCLLTPDATVIRGRGEVRSILCQLIVSHSRIEVQESSVVLAGEVALGTEVWVIASAGSSGETFVRTINPTIVMRQVEGAWKLSVAMLWGQPRSPATV